MNQYFGSNRVQRDLAPNNSNIPRGHKEDNRLRPSFGY